MFRRFRIRAAWCPLSCLLAIAACERTRPVEPPPQPAEPPPERSPSSGAAQPDAAASDAGSDAGGGDGGTADARPPGRTRAASKPAGRADGATAGVTVLEGALPVAAAREVVRAGTPKLRACFDEEAGAHAGARGKVTFRLTLDDRGRVTLGEVVTSTLGGGDPEMCMIRATRLFKFPATPGGSVVGFQVSFGR